MGRQRMKEDSEDRVLSSLIEKATHSTSPDVDQRLLKAIKSSVRSSDAQVRVAVETLMQKMKKDHAQVRYLALLIIDELFMRSKLFRSLLVGSFDQFLSLSVGYNRNLPLPPPRAVASVLRKKSIEFLEKWHGTFGIYYRQLRSAVEYLKHTLKFQFPNLLENTARLLRERREREIRSQEILLNKYETLVGSHSSIKGEIQQVLDEIKECLAIIQVKEDYFSPVTCFEDGVVEFKSHALQQMRLESLKEGEKVRENSDNKAVFDVLRELYKLLVSRHSQTVQAWISVLLRVELEDKKVRDSIMKEFIDLQNSIRAAKKKCEHLGFTPQIAQEEEDIWEEGKIDVIDDKNLTTPYISSEEIGSMSITNGGNKKEAAHTESETPKVVAKSSTLEAKGSEVDSLKTQLLSEAPVVQWGSFLDNWGSRSDVLANQRGLEVEGHWGRVDYDAVIPAERIAELNVQVSIYKEKHEEIKPCRFPLSKGGLCQRKDLRVCPFHGPIVPRDADGNPINESFPSESVKTSEQVSNPLDIENNVELADSENDDELAWKLARQAVKNVRDREEKNKADSKHSTKRAKLAKVREHNETVLRNAAVASTSRSEAFGEDVPASHRLAEGKKKQTLASMLREKVTAKDRISKKLLNSHVAEAAIRQMRQGEEAKYREAYPNQW